MNQTIQATFQRALALHQQGQLAQAEALYLEILQIEPQHADSLNLLGVIATQVDKHAIAVDLISRAIAINPKAPVYFFNRANAHKSLQQFAASVSDCEQAIRLKPDFVEAYFNCGIALQALQQFDAAVASFDRAISLRPDFGAVHFSKGVALQRQRQFAAALESYDRAISCMPGHADAHSNRGVTLKELKQLSAAVASFDRAIELKPDFAGAYSNRGNTLLEMRQVDAALDSYDRAIALAPNIAMSHANRGNALKELGRLDDALASYDRAIHIDPDFAQAIFNRGVTLQKLGRHAEAVATLDRCNSANSRAEALVSLHALREHDALFSRLGQYAVSDPGNIGVAAIAAFAAQQTGRDNPFPFCKDPLDFLHFSNLASHTSAPGDFADQLLAELTAKDAVLDPLNNITINGYQTSSDLFSHTTGPLAQLRQMIGVELAAYREKFQSRQCVLLEHFPKGLNFSAWFIRLKQQGHLEPHIHADGWISGVIYLQVVPTKDRDEGAIEFSLCGSNYAVFDPAHPRHVHRPQRGDIVLFPSSLQHRTIPFSTDTERMIVSFDLRPDSPAS